MGRQGRDYHILIGKDKYWDYIFLDDAFQYSDWFKWLTGTRMQFHTEEEYEDAKRRTVDEWWLRDLRVEAVKADRTDEGLEEWSQDVIDEWYQVWDDSYRWEWWVEEWLDIINEIEWTDYDSDYSECTWWGRCFEEDMLKRSYWERVVPINFRTLKRLYNLYEK